MGFELIERVGAPPKARLADDAVRVSVTGKIGVRIYIGASLIRALRIKAGDSVAVGFGSGNDAGKIALIAGGGGEFKLTDFGGRGSSFFVVIGASSARGLFAENFPTFTRERLEVVENRDGTRMVTFMATAEMLAVDD